jgi:hypothetical protein
VDGGGRSTDTGKHGESEDKTAHGDLRGQHLGVPQGGGSAIAGVVSE